jgi:uncharacterized membrane protein SpoIIM required for sporulation
MNTFTSKFLLVMLFAFGLTLIPSLSIAQTSARSAECAKLEAQIERYGGGQAAQLPEYCTPGIVYTKAVYLLYYIIGIAAVISLIYGGYIYMTARDNEAQIKKAKTILMWTIAGVVIAFLVAAVVGAIINLIVDNKLF